MKWILVLSMLMVASFSSAQTPAPPAASTAPAVVTAPAAAPSIPAPAVVPGPTVAVGQDSAPPAWVQELFQTIAGLPIVGPYISKAMVYLEALCGILTALVMFLLAVSSALKGVVNLTGLTKLATWIETLQQSKIMYWMTALSSVPVHVTPAQVSAPPSGQAPPATGAAT